MDSPNFGILQPITQIDPTKAATPMAQAAPLMESHAAPDDGNMAQMAQVQIDKQRLQMEQARQPGMLQGQQLDNQGKVLSNTGQQLTNKKSQMDIDATNYAVQKRQAVIKAYQDGSAKGGVKAGLDAVFNEKLNQGDVEGAMTLSETRDRLEKAEADNDKAYLTNAGTMVHTVHTEAQKNGVTALQQYTKMYAAGTVQRFDPHAPDPSKFKTNADFEDNYALPVGGVALPYQKEEAAKQKALTEDGAYKAKVAQEAAQQDLKAKILQYGASSPEARQAATALRNANEAATGQAQGGNSWAGSARAIKNLLPASMGGDYGEDDLIKQNSPKAAANPAQTSQTPQTSDSQAVKHWSYNPATGKLE